jgi:hypothetical protein
VDNKNRNELQMEKNIGKRTKSRYKPKNKLDQAKLALEHTT